MPEVNDDRESESQSTPLPELLVFIDIPPVRPPGLPPVDAPRTGSVPASVIEPDWRAAASRRANRQLLQDDPSHTSAQYHWHPGHPSSSNRPRRGAENRAFEALGAYMGQDAGRRLAANPSRGRHVEERIELVETARGDTSTAQPVVPRAESDVPLSQPPYTSLEADPGMADFIPRVVSERRHFLPEILPMLFAFLLFVYILRRLFRRT